MSASDETRPRRTALHASDARRTLSHGVNQLNWRTVPGYADILGAASTNAVVTVNNQLPYRKGEFFRKEFALDNSSAALWFPVTNLAGLHTSTNDIVVTNSGNIFIPKTTEVFGYDADGNMTNDGRWSIAWDAENRVSSFTSLGSGPSASKKKIDCSYDYAGRRVQKIISTNSSSTYVAQSTNRFAYDGWNLIGILSSISQLQSSFVWGTDLSGTAQGAGGVGGLLFIGDFASAIGYYAVAYDANGNVSALINAANGIGSAQYEYGPFGELLRSTGPMARANPLRFSTKHQDDETALSYYGFRYYNPNASAWCSRDPLGEAGGVNLNHLAFNDPNSFVDPFGLWATVIPRTLPAELFPYTAPKQTTMPPLYPPVPILPPQVPPLPNPNPPPTPSPNSTPSPQPSGPLPPDQGGPPWPYGPDGDCPPDRKRFLQNQKNAICNQPRSCDPKKCPKGDAAEIWRRIRVNEACIKARENIMSECYRGGNTTHKNEVQNVRDALEKCWKAYEAIGGV